MLIFFFNHIALSNTPVLYKVKRKEKIIKAIIAKAVIIFFFCLFIWCYHNILSIKKSTKIKNKYNIEYPNIDLAFLESNLSFLKL